MTVGIIGNGKMGKEIFNFFFYRKHSVCVVCIDGEEEFRTLVEKQLRKMLKRGLLDDLDFNKMTGNFTISDDYNTLKDCDIVIEAVFEDENLKATLFRKIESIVSDKCILATNTSSVSLKKIFTECSNKSRCAGLHFFYPVMLSQFIEINSESFTSCDTIKKLESIITDGDKKYIKFSQENNMYLNKVISLVASHSFLFKTINNVSYEYLNSYLSERVMDYSVFEMLDSIGIGIVAISSQNFISQRCRFLLENFDKELKRIIDEGCSTKPKEFLEYIIQSESGAEFINSGNIELEESIYALLMNDIVYLADQSGISSDTLKSAVEGTLGLKKTFNEFYSEYGYNTIKSQLDSFYCKTECDVYKVFDEIKFAKIYIK